MEYRIIGAARLSELVEAVNALLRLGWKVQGGVAVETTNNFGQYYLQAMIKG